MDFLLWQIKPVDKRETYQQGFNREIKNAIKAHIRRLGTTPNIVVLPFGVEIETKLQVEYGKYMLPNCFGLRRNEDDNG